MLKKSDITEEYIRNNFDINKERKKKIKKISNTIINPFCFDRGFKAKEVLSYLENFINEFVTENNVNLEDVDIIFYTESYTYNDKIKLMCTKGYIENDLEVIKRIKKREREKLTKKQLEKNKRDAEYAEFLKLKKKFDNE